MKHFITSAIATCYLASCSLTSTTFIKPNDTFVLGNNQHRSFTVKLKNTSNHEVRIWHSPIEGGQHSPFIVKSGKRANVKVAKNTALFIENNASTEASCELVITGDTGLSMGYKNR